MERILQRSLIRWLSLLCVLLCLFLVFRYGKSCISILGGNTQIHFRESGTEFERRTLNGKDYGLQLPETVYLTSDEGIAPVSAFAVKAMGLFRHILVLQVFSAGAYVCFRYFRYAQIEKREIRTLFYSGLILFVGTLLLPLVNLYLLPALVQALSTDILEIGYDYTARPHAYWGLFLILLAGILKEKNTE